MRLCKNCKRELNADKYKHAQFCNRTCKVNNRKYPWRKHKGLSCEFCKFIPIHKCQLDVDHIDGNKENNSPDNLQTLCANCHRLKTHINKDWA